MSTSIGQYSGARAVQSAKSFVCQPVQMPLVALQARYLKDVPFGIWSTAPSCFQPTPPLISTQVSAGMSTIMAQYPGARALLQSTVKLVQPVQMPLVALQARYLTVLPCSA